MLIIVGGRDWFILLSTSIVQNLITECTWAAFSSHVEWYRRGRHPFPAQNIHELIAHVCSVQTTIMLYLTFSIC